MSTNYMQTDPRWKDTVYCGEPCSVSGCGAMALASVLNVYPPEIMAWITAHGYASSGSGTYQSGINACIAAYGYDSIKLTNGSIAGQDGWAVLNAISNNGIDGQCGILLMGGQRTGCISNYWTYGGHYISIVDSDYDTLKVYDSANPARSGWHALTDFQGDIKHAWITTCPNLRSLKNMTFNFNEWTLGAVSTDVLTAQQILATMGLYTGALDGSAGPLTVAAVRAAQQQSGYLTVDGICGYETMKYLLHK